MADTKDNNVKTFNFTTDELSFLQIRQQILNETAITNSDIKMMMDNFILTVVLPRLGMNSEKFDVNFEIGKGTISFTPKVILPDSVAKTPANGKP